MLYIQAKFISKSMMRLDNFKSFLKEEKVKNKLDFLDGFRGMLCLWVLTNHTSNNIYGPTYQFEQTGHYIGVNGFFILSSFLLTYRLMDELVNKTENYRQVGLTIIKYLVRRLFRIYLPFVITVAFIKYDKLFGGYLKYPTSFYDIISLKDPAGNHLWTIAPEIKYYAIIPVFCVAFSNADKTKNNLFKLLYICSFFLFFYLCIDNYFVHDKYLHKLYGVFLNGSLLAVVYFKIQKFLCFLKSEYFLNLAGLVSMLMYMYGVTLSSLPYNPKLTHMEGGVFVLTYRVSLWWTGVLFVMLIGAPNFFNNLFEATILRTIGKFSFGIYLYHPMCITLVKTHVKTKFDYEIFFHVALLSFLVGLVFFYLIENVMIKTANNLCKKISSLKFFQEKFDVEKI